MGRVKNDGDPVEMYLRPMLKRLGKDFNWCEYCGIGTNGKSVVHHTKYDGATLYDLDVICNRCNLQTENKGLK